MAIMHYCVIELRDPLAPEKYLLPTAPAATVQGVEPDDPDQWQAC